MDNNPPALQGGTSPSAPDPIDRLTFGQVGGILRLIQGLINANKPDTLRQLQIAIASHQLAKLTHGNVVAERLPWPCVPDHRHDFLITGARGGGKTALAVAWGQQLSANLRLPLIGLRTPAPAAQALRLDAVIPDLDSARDCVLLADEAALHSGLGSRKRPILEALTLGRQRNVSIMWTAQSLSSASPDLLRATELVGFKWIAPFGSLFDRPEATEIIATAVALQGPEPDTASTRLLLNGKWYTTNNPLPNYWTEEVSRLWR